LAGSLPVVIELGDRRPLGGWSPTRQVLPARGRRGVAVAVVVAVVLIALGSSGLPGPQLSQPLWTMLGQQDFDIGASNIYLRSVDGQGVIALARETGQIRWRVPGEHLDLWSEVGEDLVFFVGTSATAPRLVAFNAAPGGEPRSRPPASQPVISVLGDRPETVIVELATGRVLTRHTGYPLGLVDGGAAALLVDWRAGPCPAESMLVCQFFVAVNVHTGADLWSLPVLSGLDGSDADPDDRVVTRVLMVDSSGLAVVHDAASGDVLASMPIGPRDTVRASVSIAGDVLFTAHEDGGGIHVSRARLDTAERVWTTTTTTVPSDPNPAHPFFELTAERDLLVLAHDGLSTMLDPQTGRVRFEVAADGLHDLGGGRLLARSLDPDAPARVLDAATGTTLGTYPGATVVADGRGHLLVIRQGGAWATVTLLDATGREMLWDAVDGDDVHCQAGLGLFACTDRSGQLRVWPVPV
jgi:outer membrane protein assembly factor BamB